MMQDKRVKMCEPEIGEREKFYVNQALDEVELSGHGRHVGEFEKRFAEYCGVNHAVMVPNGTIAPHLAMMAIGIGPGDEVVLPSQTISTVAFAVTALGATVVPCDIDRQTWTMDPNELFKVLTHSTKVVMPTPVFAGVMPDMDAINNVIQQFEIDNSQDIIHVIEDFAESIGSKYHDKMSGSFGDMGTCSLFANKNMTTGEGGVVTTNSPEWDRRLRYLRNCAYGIGPNKFLADEQGFNYRPSNLVAALGLGQLDNVDYLMQRRYDINKWYHQYLSDEFTWQEPLTDCECVPWMNGVLVPQKDGNPRRQEFMYYLESRGIESRSLFPPVGSHPYLADKGLVLNYGEEIISQYLYDNGVLLPSGGPSLTEEVVKEVCEVANEFLKE